MRILVTGVCGFVGSTLVRAWAREGAGHTIVGLDNLSRAGAEANRTELRNLGLELHHGDLRLASDVEALPAVDVVIDAAANPSVLAGADGKSSSRQVVEHNLHGTLHLLEYCKRHRAALILLSTSRVYSIAPLASLPLLERQGMFVLDTSRSLPRGVSAAGVDETFSTASPISLYGATKAASEVMALEYGSLFDFPVWINRCGVMAGAGQFGHAEQGIFSYWLHAWHARRRLRYLGFGGQGLQVRDAMHPADLLPLLDAQMNHRGVAQDRVCNISGGPANAMSLRQLSDWCAARWGERTVAQVKEDRPFDVPWLVLDSSLAQRRWGFAPRRSLPDILEEIARFAQSHPHWLDEVAS